MQCDTKTRLLRLEELKCNHLFLLFFYPHSPKGVNEIAKTEWKNNQEDHQYVYAFLIDLYHVVEVWNNSNHEEDINDLIIEINKAIINK